MKLAVVGAGVSGLVAAWLLSRRHDVTVFEAGDHVGGHTHTHDIEADGHTWQVDTGFIVYNERTYPNFISLLARLGVPSQRTRMSFSATNARSGIEYCGSSLNTLFAQRRNLVNPRFWRMLADIVRFNRAAPALAGGDVSADEALRVGWSGLDDELTLGEFLQAHGYSRTFIDNYIVGMGAAIWSCPAEQVMQFPARAFVRFFDNHGLLQLLDRPQWRVVSGGSRAYVAALTAGFAERIHLHTPVRRVVRDDNGVTLDAGTQAGLRFDGVILACHSDQALALLGDASAAERQILGAIRYQHNDVVLHTDTRLLPATRRAWACWNYYVGEQDSDDVTVTYNMNMLQGLAADTTFCVTLNRSPAIRDTHVLKRLQYAHPVFTTAALAAQRNREQISGVNHTWYCGAYWRHGFHEDGVVSALEVGAQFGESP